MIPGSFNAGFTDLADILAAESAADPTYTVITHLPVFPVAGLAAAGAAAGTLTVFAVRAAYHRWRDRQALSGDDDAFPIQPVTLHNEPRVETVVLPRIALDDARTDFREEWETHRARVIAERDQAAAREVEALIARNAAEDGTEEARAATEAYADALKAVGFADQEVELLDEIAARLEVLDFTVSPEDARLQVLTARDWIKATQSLDRFRAERVNPTQRAYIAAAASDSRSVFGDARNEYVSTVYVAWINSTRAEALYETHRRYVDEHIKSDNLSRGDLLAPGVETVEIVDAESIIKTATPPPTSYAANIAENRAAQIGDRHA